MAIFSLKHTFDEGVFDKEEYFILFHTVNNNNCPNFPYWKYTRFDWKLLDEEVCLSSLHFIKPNISCLGFWILYTIIHLTLILFYYLRHI